MRAHPLAVVEAMFAVDDLLAVDAASAVYESPRLDTSPSPPTSSWHRPTATGEARSARVYADDGDADDNAQITARLPAALVVLDQNGQTCRRHVRDSRYVDTRGRSGVSCHLSPVGGQPGRGEISTSPAAWTTTAWSSTMRRKLRSSSCVSAVVFTIARISST